MDSCSLWFDEGLGLLLGIQIQERSQPHMRRAGNRQKTTCLAAIEVGRLLGRRAQKLDNSIGDTRSICTCVAFEWTPPLTELVVSAMARHGQSIARASFCVKRPDRRSTNDHLTLVISVLARANLFIVPMLGSPRIDGSQ